MTSIADAVCCQWSRPYEHHHDQWLWELVDPTPANLARLIDDLADQQLQSALPADSIAAVDIADFAQAHDLNPSTQHLARAVQRLVAAKPPSGTVYLLNHDAAAHTFNKIG